MTPVRSIVLQALHDGAARDVLVFNSNKTPQDAAFLDDLSKSRQNNPCYTFVNTMTAAKQSANNPGEENGFITKAMLSKYINDLTLPIYYIAGPQTMVAAMRKILNESGVDDDNIRTEEFSGY